MREIDQTIIPNQKLIRFNVMNKHDRMYPDSEFTRERFDEDGFPYTELIRLNKTPIYGQFGYGDNAEKIHKYNATHSISNFRITDGWLIGDVTILNESILPVLNNLVFRPRSTGEVQHNGIVWNLDVIGFDAIVKSDDSFAEKNN